MSPAKVSISAFCQEESLKHGTKPEQYRQGIKLVELALTDMSSVGYGKLEDTDDEVHFPWWFLVKRPASLMDVHAIVEITEIDVIVHLILPRSPYI
jgi:hypothetical protein